MGAFNLTAVEVALYKVIESVDADLAFQLEQPEDGDPNKYPDLARLFAEVYRKVLDVPVCGVHLPGSAACIDGSRS